MLGLKFPLMAGLVAPALASINGTAPAVSVAAPPRAFYGQRGNRGVGTKAYQRAALKARRRKEARRG